MSRYMKNRAILAMIVNALIISDINAQGNINLGTAAGNLGTYNTSIGHVAGDKVTGHNNVFVGAYSGRYTTSGSYNIMIGREAGYVNTTGHSNAFIGMQAGRNTTSGYNNVMVGRSAGYNTTTAHSNTLIGVESGRALVSGSYNTYMGRRTGFSKEGSKNCFFGYGAGYYGNSGSSNLYMGYLAGYGPTVNGSDNIFIGTRSGASATGSGNVFIGSKSGLLETASNKFILANNENTPLIYGDFDSYGIAIGSKNLGSYKLYVAGDAFTTGLWISSDRRFKKNIKDIKGALDLVNELRGTRYEYQDQSSKLSTQKISSDPQLGFIAQEIRKIIPEAVREGEQGYLAVNYQAVIPLLTEAIKELSAEVDELQSQLKNRKEETKVIKTSPSDAEGSKAFLSQNWPNPFYQTTTIAFSLPEEAKEALIFIFDLNGKQVAVFEEILNKEEIILPASLLEAGLYHYSLVVDGEIIDTKKMVLTK